MGLNKKRRFKDDLRDRIRGYQCVYCGETATNDEHFPPASLTPFGIILPACAECNGLAGTDWYYDFYQRVQHVKIKLENRYRKVLLTPDWAEEEAEELGPGLRGNVKKWQKLKELIRTRLAWNAESYIANIDHNNYFAHLVAEIEASDDESEMNLGNSEQ